MTEQNSVSPDLERLPSRIPGLDIILGGGFFSSGVYILMGTPGSGKTLFANQLCCGHVAAGGRAVYVTLLAESHARMLQHLRPMTFFDESAIPNKLTYISAFNDLETEGLRGLLSVLQREIRARRATVLVLDGLVSAAETADNDRALKKFIYEIQTSAIFHGCTLFLLTSNITPQRASPEHTMVDGLIELEDRLFDVRAERLLQVRKFRGAKPMRGKHSFQITQDGLRVFPRIEALFDQPGRPSAERPLLNTGVHGFDPLLARQGLEGQGSTLVAGTTGTGKTTFCLHFLSQCSVQEPGLLFSFFETPDRLRDKAHALGIDIVSLENQGALKLMWNSQGEHLLDALAYQLLDAIEETTARRVVIDGLAGFFAACTHPERLGRFLACLTQELRRREVSLLMTLETGELTGGAHAIPYGLSGLIDNLVWLQRFHTDQGISRRLSIVKIRNDAFVPDVQTFEIVGGRGMYLMPSRTLNGTTSSNTPNPYGADTGDSR